MVGDVSGMNLRFVPLERCIGILMKKCPQILALKHKESCICVWKGGNNGEKLC